MMALVRSGRTGSPKRKRQERGPKQNVALFFHSNIITVAPCLHLNFMTKLRILHPIKTEDLFYFLFF